MKVVPITFVLLLGACASPTAGGASMAQDTSLEQPTTEEFEGVAHNCKGCAALVAADGGVILISGLDAWPSSVEGRMVRAAGRLVRAARLPRARQDADGAWSQGVPGSSSESWLDDATWSVVDSQPEAPWALRVSDGSGNTTTLSLDAGASAASWRYAPVTPAASSSGTYSGGEPAEGNLSAAQADELWRLVHALESITTDHVADRAMGTTQVTVESSTGKRSFVVRSGVAVDLETWLAKLRAR